MTLSLFNNSVLRPWARYQVQPGRTVKQNFSDCGFQATYGEVGWNHLFQHAKAYSVDQMTKGTVTDAQAVGRVFCN